jgi:hypothetical protein
MVSFAWSPGDLSDNHYSLVLAVRVDDGPVATVAAPFTIDRALSSVTASPSAISPNGDRIDDTLTTGFALSGPSQVGVIRAAREPPTICLPRAFGPLTPVFEPSADSVARL